LLLCQRKLTIDPKSPFLEDEDLTENSLLPQLAKTKQFEILLCIGCSVHAWWLCEAQTDRSQPVLAVCFFQQLMVATHFWTRTHTLSLSLCPSSHSPPLISHQQHIAAGSVTQVWQLAI
jgi:hypothetical protein